MTTRLFTLLTVVVSLSCLAARSDTPGAIGQPSIFWHNGQWETFKDGVWTPYGQPESGHFLRPGSGGTSASGSGGMHPGIARNAQRGSSIDRRNESSAGIGQTTIGIGQPNGIGQSTGGLGKPNVGIGRTNIGIGQPNVGIGQPNGIGQTTIGIGKPNLGIGRNNTGMAQPSAGIGQPNGIGQTTIGIGKPTSFPPQQRSSSTDTTR